MVGTTHQFALGIGQQDVWAREVSSLSLQWGAKVFDKLAADDTTGIYVWAASILLSRWVAENKHVFEGKSVLELGE